MTRNCKLITTSALICLFAGLLTACSNSKITHSYVDPVLVKLDLDGVLVVAVAKKKSARIDFEDAFAKALNSRGVRAQVSYKLVPSAKASAEEIIAAAKQANLDTILVTRYLGATTEDVYHPGTIYYDIAPAYGTRGGFGGYYGRAYEVAYEQPVWTSNVTHTVVSDLYVTENRDHMWQAISETIKASSTNKLRNDAIASLIGDLKSQGLLN